MVGKGFYGGLCPPVFDLVDVIQNILNSPEFLDQTLGPFGADTRHAGNVIRSVSRKSEDIDDLGWHDTESLFDRSDVIAFVLHRIDQGNMVPDKLQEVFVSGYNDHRQILTGVSCGQCADDIIRFNATLFQDRDSECPDDFFYIRYLRNDRLRYLLAGCLVSFVGVMAKCRPFNVKGHGNVCRVMIPQELQEHRRKPVDGVRGKTLGIGKVANGVKGPEKIIASVDEV